MYAPPPQHAPYYAQYSGSPQHAQQQYQHAASPSHAQQQYQSPQQQFSYGEATRRNDTHVSAGAQIMSPSGYHVGARDAAASPVPAGTMSRPLEASPFPASDAAGELTARSRLRQEAEEEQRLVAEALAQQRCICDICTCGKHHCPAQVHVQAHYPPDVESVARSSYPRYEGYQVQRARAPPSTVFASGEQFKGASVTKSDYSGARGAPARLARPELRSTVGGDETREFRSENADNYKFHGYAKRGAAIPAHTMHVSGEPFVGESTSKQDFPRWTAKPAESVKPAHAQAVQADETRDFQTSAAVAFNNKGIVARQPAIPFTSHVFDSEPFAGESSMKAAFQEWNQPPRESFKPRFDPAEAAPEDRQFRTEKQDNFTAKPTPGIVRARAPPSTVLESAPFQGASVTKSDYSGARGAPARLARPELRSTVGGDETREFRSENADNYKFHGYAKRGAAIPAHTMHVSGEPFVGESTSKQDFPRWTARPAESVKPAHAQAVQADETRDFQTSAAVAFNNKGVVARQPAVPFTSHLFGSDETRDFRTEHGSHFVQPPAAEACPSEPLMRQAATAQAQAQRFGQHSTRVVGGHHMYETRGGRYVPAQQNSPPGRIRF